MHNNISGINQNFTTAGITAHGNKSIFYLHVHAYLGNYSRYNSVIWQAYAGHLYEYTHYI